LDREDARTEIAALFRQHSSGDRAVLAALVSSVREELRRVARELASREDHPVRALASMGALYHQAANGSGVASEDHPAFLIVCARAMRRAVVEYMAGDGVRDGLTGTDLIAHIDAALETLDRMNERLARVVECRYFAALSDEETAVALAMDVAAVSRDWTRARAWVLRELAARTTSEGHHAPISNAAWVDAVFDDALSQPAGKLESFLERCSAAPGDLRAHVEELLRFSTAVVPRFEPADLSPEFLLSVLRASADDAPLPVVRQQLAGPVPSEPTATVPGSPAWRVVRELNDGPFGSLYLAERVDRPSRPGGVLRFVPGETNLPAFRRRLDWRALSALEHSGIARVLDAGRAEDGRVFIVSELVDGCPIYRYCDQKLLTIDQRLALFLKVCRPVQYGHRKLAVHGAIDPENVVVTAEGEVKLLDFGLAGLLGAGHPEHAGAGASLERRPSGFVSPEQRRGDPLGVACDVYQLGLLLHGLLTGAQPFVLHTSTPGTIEEVLAATPVRPSLAVMRVAEESASLRSVSQRALVRKLRGDLDAIVMYALRKEPERRYPSVSLLRSDVQRYLERRPVWAQGNGLSYRFRRFIARRSAPIAASLILALGGAVALPGPLPGRTRVPAEAARLMDIEGLLESMFAPQRTSDGGNRARLLHVEQAARIARVELAAQPVSQARLFTKIGRAYRVLGFYDRSITILEEALALRRANAGDDSIEVAETLEALGESRHRLARFDEAESDLRTAIAIRKVRTGATHPEAISATVALGELLHSRGQFVEAELLLRGVVQALRPGSIKTSADGPARGLLPRALVGLAGVVRDHGALGEAAVLYREALARLEQSGAANDQVAAAQIDFSRVLIGRAELDSADAAIESALSVLRKAYPDEHPVLAIALREYGYLRLEQGRLEDARVLLSNALRIQEEWLGRMHPLAARTRALLAELAQRGGHAAEAVRIATAALADLERIGMADHPWTVDVRATLADALIVLRRGDEALKVLRPALTSAPRVFVSYDARLTRLQSALARASKGRPDPSGE
jgi:serine/threonine-protein kinase